MLDDEGIPATAGAARVHMSAALHRLLQSSMDLTNIYRAIAPYKSSQGDWNMYKPVLLRVLRTAEVKKPDPRNSLRFVGDPLNTIEKKWLYKLFQKTQGYTFAAEAYPEIAQEQGEPDEDDAQAVGDSDEEEYQDSDEDQVPDLLDGDLLSQRAQDRAVQEFQDQAAAEAAVVPQAPAAASPNRAESVTSSSSGPGAADSRASVAQTPEQALNRAFPDAFSRSTSAFVDQNADDPRASPDRTLHILGRSSTDARMTQLHQPRFWRGSTEAQMHNSWRAPMHRHVRHPGRRMRTGAGMSAECENEFANEHDTTVKELASDLKDSLPLGLSLALRAATGNADLVKAAEKIKTKHGHVDYAGVLKGVLPESVTHAAAQAKKLQTGDVMPFSDQDKDLTKSLEALQLRVPVWQRSRLVALREFVARDLQKVQRREPLDVNSEAANLIARLGILKAAQQANLGSRHADTIAVHLK